jgi:3-hydroxyisobutyrate dehydrogenase-like beta-hydroxyacid dehydrogenase
MLDTALDPGFRAVLHAKALRLALDLARETSTAMPTAGGITQLFPGLVGEQM